MPMLGWLYIYITQKLRGPKEDNHCSSFLLHNFSWSECIGHFGRPGLPIHATTVTLKLLESWNMLRDCLPKNRFLVQCTNISLQTESLSFSRRYCANFRSLTSDVVFITHALKYLKDWFKIVLLNTKLQFVCPCQMISCCCWWYNKTKLFVHS